MVPNLIINLSHQGLFLCLVRNILKIDLVNFVVYRSDIIFNPCVKLHFKLITPLQKGRTERDEGFQKTKKLKIGWNR